MATTLNIEYQRFEDLNFDIATQCTILRKKRENIDLTFEGNEELQAVWMMDSWSAADSLHRKEKQVNIDRKKLHDINAKILSLYMRVLSIQSSKIESVRGRIKRLYDHGNPEDTCPADFTVTSFQEWSRTNPKIHALQSEILDLLAQKIKLKNLALNEQPDTLETSNCFDASVDIEKLRSKTYFFVERDPLVDTDFTLHVSKLVTIESETFESGKMRDFIHYCWDQHERNTTEVSTLAESYQEFVGALTEHVLTKYGYMRRSGSSKIEITRDQIFAIIEGQLIPHINDCIFKDHSDDAILKEQYENLSGLTQADMGIRETYIDHAVHPFHDAILKLKTLSMLKLPTQKLRAVILSSHAAMKRMAEISSSLNLVAGADELMDVLVYVVLHAGIKDLCANLAFLKDFCNPNYMLSETGYYLSSLELAAEYIKGINAKDMTDGASKKPCVLFATLKSKAITNLCESDVNPIELVQEDFMLKGYEAVMSLEWLPSPCRFVTAVFQECSGSSVTVSVYRIKEETCLFSLKNIFHTELSCIELKPLSLKNKIYIPVVDVNETSAGLTIPRFIRIENNLEQTASCAMEYLTITFLGMESNLQAVVLNLADVQSGLKILRKRFDAFFAAYFIGVEFSPATIVSFVQTCLKKNGFHSQLLPVNGSYSVLLRQAVERFQHDYNSTMDPSKQLRTDGVVDKRTFELLRDVMK